MGLGGLIDQKTVERVPSCEEMGESLWMSVDSRGTQGYLREEEWRTRWDGVLVPIRKD